MLEKQCLDIGHLFGTRMVWKVNAGCLDVYVVDDTSLDHMDSTSAYKGFWLYILAADGKPWGDSFDIDYVAHEMGTQLGGNHTSRTNQKALESDCRKLCYEKLTADGYNVTNTNTPRRNITTVINIHNIINNTNIIDIPIDVNNTNINNITISDRSNDEEEEEEGEEDEQSYAKEYDKCCYIYSPRKCSKLDTYPFFKCVQET
ncbi:hypothetical protein FQA39_LY18778 [Lamprigera yunnana]|nr:hypothetical protein FQA39_LY18778 [Lamprigera yunnana]